MGLGGYLAGRSDAEHYESEYKREIYEIEKLLDHEKDEVIEILETYGLTRKESLPIVESLASRPKDFADFMMRFELGLEKPKPKRGTAKRCDHRRGIRFRRPDTAAALHSVCPMRALLSNGRWAVTVLALFIFGYVKGQFTGAKPFKSAIANLLDRQPCGGRGILCGEANRWLSVWWFV